LKLLKLVDFYGVIAKNTRSSADAEKSARRRITRMDEKYWQVLRRRTAISYAEGVLTYLQAVWSYSTAIAPVA